MKEAIIQQYTAIRDTIKANVQTIGNLIRQAESLKAIVTTINEENTKLSLEKQIAEIETTITTLIHQTDNLFEQYQRFVEQIFSQKQ